MSILTKITYRLHDIALGIHNPHLLQLVRSGVIFATFQKLNQPWFQALDIATVLDIGANTGQFAATINAIIPNARLYSFEPLPDCFAKLQSRMRDVSNFTALNLALGDQSGCLEFKRNTFTSSSSFLNMTESHGTAFPFTRHSDTVVVKVEKLDNIAEHIIISDPLMIKIDVQGYEDRVLRGGEQTIKRAKLIITETSFERLYMGQPLFDDVYGLLTDWGFTYKGSLDKLIDPRNGRTLQEDSVFINPNIGCETVS